MKPARLAITGMGLVSALGWTAEETWTAIDHGRSGLGKLTLFHSPRFGHLPVGEVRGDLATASGLKSGSRSDHLAAYAARAAFINAGLDALPGEEKKHVGLVLGASTGGLLSSESFLRGLIREGQVDTSLLRHHECAHATNLVAHSLGIGGFRATVSTACSSGAMAISTACDALCMNEARIMLAGGVDSLTRLTLNGFGSLLILSPDGCRPFEAGRRGMSLGEGAAVLVLEPEDGARARKAPILAYLAGRGNTCDAYHATRPSPDGSGIHRAMVLALKDAGLKPADVSYVNAHGTGTVDNDLAESRALTRLFGDRPPPISSTKRFFGHTLAAAGAIEAAVCVLAIQHQRLPVNLGLNHLDPEISFMPVTEPVNADLKAVLSNSLGFGGACSSLVICRGDS